ncbi:hypothetical protein B0H34DRAFT_652287 [Crassisporium funariophilum]|nr:hypothetical protein B0H34DRAFT_652287 [Crassisporium funariophilum]
MQPRSFGLPPAPSAFYSPPFIPAVPHPVYWFMDGSITFRVKNTTYRVHRHHFQQHSEYFRSYLETVDSDFTRGPFTPIELSNVQTHEFERLLSIFYPSNLANRGLTTAEEWRSILTLSIRWRFPQLKVLAIRKLGQVLSTVDKIVLAQAHGVLDVHWLLPAYAELCTMDRPVKLEDAEKLGMQTVLKIWQVQHLRSTLGLNEPCDHLVKDEFGLP